ncbi:branched-chain amino acid transport system II carrier protein [Intestinibacter sp.]|uniref:branched-chain amino acid transport system II carrier protein n=1 Tax=Intestinibacter sp. TaxID=1965304 RepID=UPI002A90D276|nr:branched-chain amino acid transport system II carrier protein [Intestinibacter sp.]MDY5212510.1 branched-chain amino acid transport system II carrier protein [Intestinibacter sp.]
MNKKNKDIIITGFALFAMFFGAGNLIFPPYLGVITGDKFLVGFLGFIIADVGLSLLAILAAAKTDGDTEKVFGRAGKLFAVILGSAIMICLGPLLAIPRTAATTFEMGVSPIVPGFNSVLFSTIFFAITLALTIKPSKVVDIIGSYLTPALLVCLLVIIAIGIINPIGSLNEASIQNVFNEGILQGYQTLDALGAICLSAVLIKSLVQKGYKEEKDRVGILLKSGFIAAIGLAVVYGGLTYLGATVSSVYDSTVSQSTLIVAITIALLGTPGKIILSLIVTLACLTTAIGLTSATAEYFSTLTKNKLKYEHIVIAVCIFSLAISTLGVGAIIKISAPILSLIYPATIVLVMMTIFKKYVKNDNIVKGATYVALIMGILMAAKDLGVNVVFIDLLPFANLGFCWVVPAVIGGLLGSLINPSKKVQDKESEDIVV